MKYVIKTVSDGFVRDGHQPPAFPSLPAATRALTDAASTLAPRVLLVGAAGLLAAVLLAAGCGTPVDVTGDYSLPGTNITGSVAVTTNGLTVGGSYQTGATNIGGSVTVGK